MPIRREDVKEGHCYATPNNQHRRVTKVSAGNVTYQSWGGNAGYQGGSLRRNTTGLDTFVKAIEKELPCDAKLPPIP